MIIRRVAQAVREQNWFTVAVEVAVVVAGIFIGLQVDDWNQQRLERESDQRALALFIDELDLMLQEAGIDLAHVDETMLGLSSGMGIALKCDATTEERALLTNAIGNTLNWRVPDIRPSGLAEIGNSGTLARLGNPELSRAVGTVNQTIRAIDDAMHFLGPQYDRAWRSLLPDLLITAPMRLEKVDVGVFRPTASEFMSLAPQESLCKSREFQTGLMLLTDFYGSAVYLFEEWQRNLQAARDLAEAEIR